MENFETFKLKIEEFWAKLRSQMSKYSYIFLYLSLVTGVEASSTVSGGTFDTYKCDPFHVDVTDPHGNAEFAADFISKNLRASFLLFLTDEDLILMSNYDGVRLEKEYEFFFENILDRTYVNKEDALGVEFFAIPKAIHSSGRTVTRLVLGSDYANIWYMKCDPIFE